MEDETTPVAEPETVEPTDEGSAEAEVAVEAEEATEEMSEELEPVGATE